jgi:iron complex transport system ATP-binding protein
VTPLLRARGLTLRAGERLLCAELDLEITPGQRWALLGVNGSGKTTLLHTLAGLRAPFAGSVELDGADLAQLGRRAVARRLGLLPQDTPDPFPATVMETALLGRHPFLSPWGRESAADRAQACAALKEVGLGAMGDRSVAGLSGGERRRLAFAVVRVQDPALWLLDEPTNHLDLRHQALVLERMGERCAAGAACLMSLHDPNLAARHASHALLLFGDGRWEAGERDSMLTAERLSRLYGHPLREVEVEHRRLFVPL